MPVLTLKQKDNNIIVTNNVDTDILTLRMLRYPTKSVPVPVINKVLTDTLCSFTKRYLPVHMTLLKENKALLHSHVYQIGEYFTLLLTDSKDEEELSFNITQSIPDSDIQFGEYRKLVNDASVITNNDGMVDYLFSVTNNEVRVIPSDKNKVASIIIYKLHPNSITIECDEPQHKMRYYIPAALFVFSSRVQNEQLISTYNNTVLTEVSNSFKDIVNKFRQNSATDDDIIKLTTLRYTYFKYFCKAMTAIKQLPNGKDYIKLIDVKSNCSFSELRGTQHWLYETANYFNDDCMTNISKLQINSNKKEKGWL